MANTPNPEWRIARQVIMAMLFLLAGLAAAEVYVRYDDLTRYGTPLLHTPNFGSDLTVHDSLGVRGRPNGVHKKWRLNSAGFRSPESTLVLRPRCTVVAILGASETFGYEERAGKEYPAQLADSLASKGCFRVINAGLTGASLVASRQNWILWVSRFNPAVVIVYVNPIPFVGESAPTAPLPAATPQVVSTPIRPRLVDRAKDFVAFPEFVQHRRLVRMVESLERGHEPSWFLPRVPQDRLRSFVAELDTLVSSIEAKGGRPVLVFHALRDTSLTSERARYGYEALRQFGARARSETIVAFDSAAQQRVVAAARVAGTPLVNLRSTLSGHDENFVDAVHFTELGAARVAHQVIDHVVRASQSRVLSVRVP